MAPAGGNVKKMTVMGDALMDRLSDRGSIPLRSTDEPEFGYYEFGFGWFSFEKSAVMRHFFCIMPYFRRQILFHF